jgi:hypothetical protein
MGVTIDLLVLFTEWHCHSKGVISFPFDSLSACYPQVKMSLVKSKPGPAISFLTRMTP